MPDGQEVHTLQDRKKVVSAVRVSPDGKWVAAASYGGRAKVWTLDGQDVVGIAVSKKNLSSVAFSPDTKLIATSGLGDDITVWALPSGEQVATLSGHEVAVWSLKFLAEGRRLVSLGYERTIRFWDTGTWKEARAVDLARADVRGIAFSSDEKSMALSTEGKVEIWSLPECEPEEALPVSTKVVSSLAFSPDGRWLAAGAADRKIRVWAIP